VTFDEVFGDQDASARRRRLQLLAMPLFDRLRRFDNEMDKRPARPFSAVADA